MSDSLIEMPISRIKSNIKHMFLHNPPEEGPKDSWLLLSGPPCNDFKLDNVFDFSHICRICAAKVNPIVPIYESYGKDTNLAAKINAYLPITVSPTDKLPLKVCSHCMHMVLAWHELAKVTREADEALRERYQEVEKILEEEKKLGIKREEKKSEDGKCPFCGVAMTPETRVSHFLAEHRRRIFHCLVCDDHQPRYEMLAHMLAHAVIIETKNEAHYARELQIKREQKQKRLEQQNKMKREREPSPGPPPPPPPPPRVTRRRSTADARPAPAPRRMPARRCSERRDSRPAPAQREMRPPLSRPKVVVEFSDRSDAGHGPAVLATIKAADEPAPGPSTAPAPPPPLAEKKHKRPRTCPICLKTYTASSSYFYHMKHHHTDVREHACDVCGRAFATRGALQQHAALHSAERRYECGRCGKRFRARASLYIHAQTHGGAGGKPFRCERCPMAFRWRAQLARHSRRHSGARAHLCPERGCRRAFAVRCDMLRHWRTHSRARIACPLCPAQFAQPRYLKVHTARKHPDAPPADTKPAHALQ